MCAWIGLGCLALSLALPDTAALAQADPPASLERRAPGATPARRPPATTAADLLSQGLDDFNTALTETRAAGDTGQVTIAGRPPEQAQTAAANGEAAFEPTAHERS